MKIGFSTSVIQRGKTGVAQYVFGLLRAFDAAPSEHQFVLFALQEDLHFFKDYSSRFEIVPVDEKYRPPIKNILWHQALLPRLAKSHELDLLHVPSYRRLLWQSSCARVGTIHDLAPFHVSKKYDLARMFYGRVVVKYLARCQDQLVAVSENTAQDIKRFFNISPDKVNVVHNGLDHGRFFPQPPDRIHEVSAKFKLDRPFFLYVARLEHPGKNHVRLITAFERFKESTKSDWLLALGGSDWHGAEIIHERISNSPFRNDIRPLGFVSDAELPALYSGAASFVYPSLFEGFGMPPTEAMACGSPVICSARGSLGEVVGSAAVIVEPEDISSISDALVKFYSSAAFREDFRKKGFLRAAEFSWERTARETLKVYSTAVAGRRKFAPSGSLQRFSAPAAPLSSD
jgi:glycosyltransferase involved in cell wall biosynthesis